MTPRKAPTKQAAPPAEPLHVADAAAWEAWLRAHHATSDGVWLRLAKKGAPTRSVTYLEAVEAALCWGWIDGQSKPIDAHAWMQRYTPRRARSMWSKVNRARVAALEAAGRMQPPGRAEVERAKADGRWDAAYDAPSTMTVPDDFATALARSTRAKAAFEALDRTNRYAMLWRIQQPKRAATRAARIAQFVAMLERGETIHPSRKKRE